MDQVTGTEKQLSKKQKGRLKKLRNRANETKQGCEISGLSNLSNWNEFCELLSSGSATADEENSNNSSNIHPSVRRRSKKSSQRADGMDHRDILFQLFHRVKSSKKRLRSSSGDGGGEHDVPNIPPWATLHNACSLKSLVVVQVALPKDADMTEFSSKLLFLKSKKNNGVPSCLSLPVETRWFQGHRPKSISEVLFYYSSPPKPVPSTTADEQSSTSASITDLLRLETLTADKLCKEGYPRVDYQQTKVLLKHQQTTRVSLPQSNSSVLPSLEEAEKIVHDYQVAILKRPKEEEGDDTTPHWRYVATIDKTETKATKVFALDCEMVLTELGQELGRVTIIQLDENNESEHKLVLDELVKPRRPVLDYLTRYSGIAASDLETVETRLEQIQAFLLREIKGADILVGHSLENDLRVLGLAHETIVDTAILFQSKRNKRKHSLRHLSAVLLNRKIQQGNDGHCSEEDAVATLQLAVQRARKGPSFQIFESNDDRVHLCDTCDDKDTIVAVGPGEWLKHHISRQAPSAHCLSCESLDSSIRNGISAWNVNPKKIAKLVVANFVADSGNEKDADLLNQTMTKLLGKMLPGTLVLLALQKGFGDALSKQREKRARQHPKSSLRWTDEDEESARELADVCRSGYVYWISSSTTTTNK